MTTAPPETAHHEPSGTPQPFLPFAGDELLRVRVRQADFARMLGVDKATVCRWVQKGVITLGADGRVDPQRAMQQLLRSGDPGRIRARIVRQAFADMGDLRAQAAMAAQLEELVAELRAVQAREDGDYERVDGWLNDFEERVAEIPQNARAELDAVAWRAYVRDLILAVMAPPEETLAELDRQIEADLRALAADEEGEGAHETAPAAASPSLPAAAEHPESRPEID